MYPKFIELHMNDAGSGIACTFNTNHITDFWKDEESGLTRLYCTGFEDAVWIQESYEEVKKLIHDAGVFVQQTDPRLDVTHALTMKDLEKMKSGEPVWNSNRNEWYLLRTMTEDGEVWFSDFVGSKVIATEEMLIKTPLYRMKVE